MDAQTVRTALGTIQSNPSAEEAWQNLNDALFESGGDLDRDEALTVLQAARERHAARGEADAVARLLEMAARLAEGTPDQGALLMELSQVLLEDLFAGSRAMTVLERAVQAGGDADAIERLEELQKRAERWKDQSKTYLHEADNATDDDYRSAMLMRSAEVEICFSSEPNFSKIVENLELALRLDQANIPAARLLEVIYRRQTDWQNVVRVLERTADRAPDHLARVAAGIRLARLYQHYFDDAEKAAAAYDRVLASDPTQADAMEYVTEYYSQGERWDELVRAYERPLKADSSGAAALGDMLQVAMLHWKKRNAPVDAEPWFEKIRALEPANDIVLSFFREYKASLHDDAGLVQVLDAARGSLPESDSRHAELGAELQALQDDQVGAQKQIEQHKSELRSNPDDEEARTALKTLYKQTQGHNALVELLRQEHERIPEEDLERRLATLREIASVYRQYIKSETALVGVLNQIVQLDGKLDEHDVDEVRELVSLYERLQRPRDLLASQKLLAEIVPDKSEKIAIYRQVGRRWLEQFSNVQHAMEAFAALYELDSSDAEAIERLEDLYRKRRAWKELYALYEQQLSHATGEARVPLLNEMAQLAADRLSRVDDALDFYRQILDIDPTRTEVIDRLEKYAERGKQWDVLADVLERRLSAMPEDETRLPVLQKLGTVYGEHLDRPEDAIGTWRRVVDVQPGHPRAMRVLRDTYLKDSRFDDLEELYTSQKDLEGLAEVLSTAADRNKDPAEKLDLSFRAARVYEQQLGQAARAIRSYERILSIDPKEARAINRLLPLYEQDEKWVRIPPLLEVLVELSEDVEDKVRLYEQLIQISGARLGDKKGAYTYAKAAFVAAPELPRTMELLDSTARSAGEWEDMVVVLNERFVALGGSESAPSVDTAAASVTEPSAEADSAPAQKKGKRRRRGRGKGAAAADSSSEIASDPSSSAPSDEVPVASALSAEARAVSLRIARVLGEELGRTEDAAARLKALAQSAPRDESIMSALDSLLRRESRPDDMRWLLAHRATHAETEVERADILNEWAAYEETTLGSPENALERYSEAVEARPDDVLALEAIARLSLGLNQPERAAEAIVKHRDQLSGTEAAYKDAMLAELLADRLSQPVEALAAGRRALEGGVEPGAVIPVLRRLQDIDIPEVRADVARILSEQYEADGDARQEADAVRALISETTDAAEQIELYKKLADIFEGKLSEPGAALSVVVEALKHHPTEMDLWDRAGPLAGIAGRPTDLADAYRTVFRGDALDDDMSLELARRAAELHENNLGDPQGAVPFYEKVLVLVPDDEDAFARLKEILTAGERWRELEKLYDREIQRSDVEGRKIDMLAEVAMLAEDIMGDAPRAIGYHQRILELDADSQIALEGLDRLYSRLDRKEELLPLLLKRADMAVGEEQFRHLVRVAKIALALHQPDVAMSAIERVLNEEPGNYEARDIAEELLQIGRVRVRAAVALEVVYESKDEIRDLVRVLGVRVEALRPREDEELDEATLSEREDERRDILRRIATLRDDRLHDDEGSFDVFAELAPLDPVDADLRERLVDSGRRLGRSAKVVEVLLAAAQGADSPALQAEIYLQAAEVQGDLLDDAQGAEETYRKVVELRADEPDAALSAARAIEELLVGSERSEELAAILAIQIELEQDFERKAELLARLAHLRADVLGQTSAALEAWEQRLADNADDPEALRNLTELYEKEGRYADVARVLEQRRDASMDDKERVSLARHLADVQERHLGELNLAVESYQSILDDAGPSAEVLSALARLYEKLERWEELADICQRQSEVLEDEVERLAALSRLGTIRAERLEDLPGALEAYRRALSVDMTHAASRQALTALLAHEDTQSRLEAAEILHPIYEAEANHEQLLHVLAVEAKASDDPSFRVSRYESALLIAEDSLHDKTRAFELVVSGIVEAAPLGDIEMWLSALERLAEATQQREKQVDVLELIVGEIFDADRQIEVQKRIAQLRREALGDAEGAVAAYEKVLEFAAEDGEALAALEELHRSLKNHEALLAVLEQRMNAALEDAERKAIAFRKAELLAGALENTDAAIETYEGILDIELDAQAIVALERLYSQTERFDDLNALIQRRIDQSPGDTAALRVQLAAVCADKQKDTERALDELEQALAEDAQHAGAVALLERLLDGIEDAALKGRAASLLEPVYMVRADYDRVLSVLTLRLKGSDDPDERRELVTRIAQIYEEQKEDYLAALEVTAQLLDDEPSDELTLEEMERLAKVANAPVRLAELVAAVVSKIENEDDSSARLCRRAGEIFADAGRNEEALGLLKRALAFEPESTELFDGVDALLKKIGTAEQRVELHRAALEHRYDPEDQRKLLVVIAELEESKLGNVDAAIEAHRQAVEADETNDASLDALTRLYIQTENWTDLAELYERRAETEGPTDGAKYRIALADLHMRTLGQHEPALDQLEEIVRDNPEFAPAIERLEAMRKSAELLPRVVELLRPIYQAKDDWRHLILLNEDRFSLADDPMDQVAILRETADFWENRGNDLLRARRVFAEAFRLQPEDEELRGELERLVTMTEEWGELAELYAEVLAEHPDLMGRPEVVKRLADLYDVQLDDPRAALDRNLELVELDPSDVEPTDQILRLSLLLGDWSAREKALVAKSEAVYDDFERSDILARLGELRERTLDDVDGAVAAYEQAFEANDQSAEICDRLIELYEAREDAGRLVELYQARVEGGQANDDLRFDLLNRSAVLLETKLSDPGRAIEALSQALSARPGDTKTIVELNRLYRSEEMWNELLDNLRLEAGTAESVDKRLAVRHEIAFVLSDKLESYEDALEAFGVILDEKPDDEKAIDAVFALAAKEEHLARPAAELLVPALRQTSLRARLVDALRLRLSDEQEPHARVETLRTIAQVFEDDLQDQKSAFESYLKAIGETPEVPELFEQADRLAEVTNGWARYAEVLKERTAEVFDSEVAGAMWVRLAKMYEERLDQKENAIEAYQAACEQTGDRLDLLDALDRLHSSLKNTAEVVELLERRMALADSDEEHSKLLTRQGQLQLDEQKSPGEAVSSFRQALERNLHNQDASDQLKRLLKQDEYFEEAFEILDGVFRDRPAGEELAELHKLRVARADSPELRLDMRRGLAQVLEEECKDPLAAQRVLLEGLGDDIMDEGLRDEIERLLPITGQWAEAAAAVLEAIKKDGVDAETGERLAERAAGWYRDKAGDSEAAEKALQLALTFNADSDEVLEQLEALQSAEGREESLITTLNERARVAMDEGTKVEFLRRVIALAEPLGKNDVAETALRAIIESDPNDLAALEGLTHVRRAAKDYEETFSLIQQRLELEDDPDKIRVLKFDAAEIARKELNKLDDSIELLEELMRDDAQDAQVIGALQSAYEEAGRFEDLGQLIESQLGSASDPAIVGTLKIGLARLRREQFKDDEAAIALLREVYAADSSSTEAADLLAEIFEAGARQADLVELLTARAQVASASGEDNLALEFLRRAAKIAETELKDLDQALHILSSVREKEDTLSVMEEILRVMLLADKKVEAAALLEEICESLEGEPAVLRRNDLIELYRTLENTAAVIATMETSLGLAPENATLRAALRKEYEAAGEFGKVIGLVVEDAEKAGSDAAKIALYREAAGLALNKAKDPAQAASLLGKAAELAPEDRELLLELCDAYSASGRGQEAVGVLEQVVESYGGKRSKELGEIHRRLATAYLSQSEMEKALGELDKAFRIEPGNLSVLKQLGEVALETGDMKKAMQMFRALLLQKLDDNSPITKAEVFCRLGQVHQKLGEGPKAKQMYERALQQDAELQEAKEGLASL